MEKLDMGKTFSQRLEKFMGQSVPAYDPEAFAQRKVRSIMERDVSDPSHDASRQIIPLSVL